MAESVVVKDRLKIERINKYDSVPKSMDIGVFAAHLPVIESIKESGYHESSTMTVAQPENDSGRKWIHQQPNCSLSRRSKRLFSGALTSISDESPYRTTCVSSF